MQSVFSPIFWKKLCRISIISSLLARSIHLTLQISLEFPLRESFWLQIQRNIVILRFSNFLYLFWQFVSPSPNYFLSFFPSCPGFACLLVLFIYCWTCWILVVAHGIFHASCGIFCRGKWGQQFRHAGLVTP